MKVFVQLLQRSSIKHTSGYFWMRSLDLYLKHNPFSTCQAHRTWSIFERYITYWVQPSLLALTGSSIVSLSRRLRAHEKDCTFDLWLNKYTRIHTVLSALNRFIFSAIYEKEKRRKRHPAENATHRWAHLFEYHIIWLEHKPIMNERKKQWSINHSRLAACLSESVNRFIISLRVRWGYSHYCTRIDLRCT